MILLEPDDKIPLPDLSERWDPIALAAGPAVVVGGSVGLSESAVVLNSCPSEGPLGYHCNDIFGFLAHPRWAAISNRARIYFTECGLNIGRLLPIRLDLGDTLFVLDPPVAPRGMLDVASCEGVTWRRGTFRDAERVALRSRIPPVADLFALAERPYFAMFCTKRFRDCVIDGGLHGGDFGNVIMA